MLLSGQSESKTPKQIQAETDVEVGKKIESKAEAQSEIQNNSSKPPKTVEELTELINSNPIKIPDKRPNDSRNDNLLTKENITKWGIFSPLL